MTKYIVPKVHRIEEAPTPGHRGSSKKPDRTIDVCLSCPYKYCRGECDRVRRKGNAG